MISSVAVSVVMPVYNARRYLMRAVQSILDQTFTDFEFIIVDDGSTDRSLKIIRDFEKKDGRIKVISRPNTGIVGALNDGLQAARGDLIARMDADDVALPERFEKQIAYMQENPECVILGTGIFFMDAAGNIVKRCERPPDHETIEKWLLNGDAGAMIHPSVMMRREAFEKIGGYRQKAKLTEELDLFLRLAQVGRLANLEELLLLYRVHFHSFSWTKGENIRKCIFWIMEQAYAARGLPFNWEVIEAKLTTSNNPRAHQHRDWAVTSFEFGARYVPLKHALAACLLEPSNRQSWKCLSYAVKKSLNLI